MNGVGKLVELICGNPIAVTADWMVEFLRGVVLINVCNGLHSFADFDELRVRFLTYPRRLTVSWSFFLVDKFEKHTETHDFL